MKKKKITINVEGVCNSGKSRITYLLKTFLRLNGFNVKMQKDICFRNEKDFDRRIGKTIKEFISGNNDRINIKINQITLDKTLKK